MSIKIPDIYQVEDRSHIFRLGNDAADGLLPLLEGKRCVVYSLENQSFLPDKVATDVELIVEHHARQRLNGLHLKIGTPANQMIRVGTQQKK